MRTTHDPAPHRWHPLALGAAIALGACPSEGRRPIGSACDSDGQCDSGLCLEDTCLDPSLDNDSDGLINSLEGQLATNPLQKDSDGDGREDAAEVGTTTAPTDFDGDKKIDAVESDQADADSDCLVDERDPDDATATHDPAVLGELGCCCAGHCDPGATATCEAGRLVCATPEPDRDHDGTPDACDTAALTLTASEAAAFCPLACGRATEACPDLAVPGDCTSDCVALAADEGLWAANYACMATACDAGASGPCFGAESGFAEPAACADICHNAVRCGALTALGIESESECRAMCAGLLHAAPTDDFAQRLQCIGKLTLPADSCLMVELAPCFEPEFGCDVICARLDPNGPNGSQACPAGAPIYDRWPDRAACLGECKARGGFGRAALLGCVGLTACSAPREVCTPGPTAIAPAGCQAMCDHVATKCPFEPWNETSTCGAVCAGLAVVAPWMDPGAAAALACIDAAETCPADNQGGPMALAVGCALTGNPACTDLCRRVSECQVPLPGDCMAQCSSISLSVPEQTTAIMNCTSQAGDCKSVQTCLKRASDIICPPACAHVLECDQAFPGGFDACQSECLAAVGAQPGTFGRWTCEAVSSSCRVDCTVPGDAPAACVAACAGSDACIEKGYGLCEAACRGIVLANGESTNAACVVEHLGRACNLFDMGTCLPQ